MFCIFVVAHPIQKVNLLLFVHNVDSCYSTSDQGLWYQKEENVGILMQLNISPSLMERCIPNFQEVGVQGLEIF